MINIVKKYSNNSIEELKKKGIYLIYFKNKLGFYYVGSTKCKDGFYRRWYQHLYKLRKNEHSSPFLQYYKISSGALNQALKGKVKISKNSIWKYLNYQNPWDSQKS